MKSKLRIIAGDWRGQVIRFDAQLDIRPTTDFSREMLFNWLQDSIAESKCLDLFAGSGALGLEALSRGASRAVLVDHSELCVRQLRKTKQKLNAGRAEIVCMDALKYLQGCNEKFDIVFLDPPFYQGMLDHVLRMLDRNKCFTSDGRIYVEFEKTSAELSLPTDWTILKSRISGNRQHHLILPCNK